MSQNDLFIASYLKNEKFSETQYNLLGRVITEIDNVISDDQTAVTKMHIGNFSKDSYYFGFCTNEKASKLTIDGEISEPESVRMEIGDTDYFGYFWFCKSADKPVVQVCEE